MRVLYLTNCPSPYRVDFFNELSKYCELKVLFEVKEAAERDKKWKSEEKFSFQYKFMKSKAEKAESAFCPEVVQHIQEYKKDVIVVGGYSTPTGMYSIFYMKMFRIKYILNSDGGLIKGDNKLKYLVKRFFIGKASAWLSTGTICDNYLIHYGARKDRIYHYSFTSIKDKEIVDVDADLKIELKNKLGINMPFVILFVGSFIKRKGIDILLEACKNLQGTAVILAGGESLNEFQSILDGGSNKCINAVGFKSKKELMEYYMAADLFILPTREDIWGLVVNEAMSCGLPVITTDQCVAGLELIENMENGFIIQSENAESLRRCVEMMMKETELLKKMGNNCKVKMKEYTIEKMAAEHIVIFTDLMKQKSS